MSQLDESCLRQPVTLNALYVAKFCGTAATPNAMFPRRTFVTILLGILIKTTQAARHRDHTRRYSARRPAAHDLGSSFLSFGSFSIDHKAAARSQDPHELQRQFCLTVQPEASDQAPNISRVPISFHDLTFSIFCYQQQDVVSNNILSSGSWESGTGIMLLDTLQKACEKHGVPKEDAIFLDIGANIGWYSLLFAAAGYPVISFEPMQANEQLFRRSICSNSDFQQRLTYHTDMLSNAPHKNCTMFSDADNFGDGTVSCDQHLQLASTYHVREAGIDMKTLDIVLADLHHPVFMMKMDVEGYEGHVLQGATKTILQAQVPYLMFEFSYAWVKRAGGHPDNLLKALIEAGYQCSFDAFHGATFDPLVYYADPAAQESDALPNIFCVHKKMLVE